MAIGLYSTEWNLVCSDHNIEKLHLHTKNKVNGISMTRHHSVLGGIYRTCCELQQNVPHVQLLVYTVFVP